MIRNLVLVGVASVLLVGCSPTQQAALQAPAVYQTIVNPNITVQNKACTVIAWGSPIAQERIAQGKMTLRQVSLAHGALMAAQRYCMGGDLSWQQRALVAADELSKVLWDIYR